MRRVLADKVLEIGTMLASERNYHVLLAKIVDCAMELTDSDGGTLYLYEEDKLKFCITKNVSMGMDLNGVRAQKYPPVAMNEKNICAYAAIHRKLLNIEDAYSCKEFDFRGPKEYDKLTGYRTKSLLVFPLVNHEEKLLGVVELINAKNEAGEVVSFEKEYEQILESLGAQAAVALSNMKYVSEIEQLMISMTRVFTDAIDNRTPYNYFHSRNVFLYVKMLVDYINRKHQKGECDYSFSVAVRDEILSAALMHDIGKLAVPHDILDKKTRLGNKLPALEERYKLLKALYRIDCLEGRISADEWERQIQKLEAIREKIQNLNGKPELTEEDLFFVEEVAGMQHVSMDGVQTEYLQSMEKDCLTVKKGTLTKQERQLICSHVEFTEKYLRQMKFEKRYPHIIKWAGAHHEYLDGSGYPRGLKGDEIPFEARILVVVDVFEALTSSDRPYKEPLEEKRALSVLEEMGKQGKIDTVILALFKEALEEDGMNMRLFHQ